ncbi:NAD(P)H-binding protein [Paramixta manurensis]|uniref:NAD(P)H-binding protein n=1 Tax=Paramixta manurensis TaxID=2740817 RepID=A0A6M8U5Y3_9GAMM|nr:NAD(P)H-binding protein [Erwiniaceae bacterium PD-1]
MKVLILGATGMVGQGVLLACLQSTQVKEILLLVRRSPTLVIDDPRVRIVVCSDLSKVDSLADAGCDVDACFFCIGVSAVGMEEARYRQITYDMTLNVARQLANSRPEMTFIYVSGSGADSSEQGRVMWARVRGQTENALRQLPFKQVIIFRPGIIIPGKGIRSSTRLYRWTYRLLGPLFLLIRPWSKGTILTTEVVGKAMLNSVGRQDVQGIMTTQDIDRLADSGR